jgi:hypothetical protein
MNIPITCSSCDHKHTHDIPESKRGLEVETICPQCKDINIVELDLLLEESPPHCPRCDDMSRRIAELEAMLPRFDHAKGERKC